MLTLHNLQKSKSSTHRKKRVGRGDASGLGTYSGRGLKGQRSRSGGKSGLALRSIKSYLLRIPKVRGFKSLNSKMATVNTAQLNQFDEGSKVNDRELLKAGLITTINNGVKILSDGEISKALTVEANAFSAKAAEKIAKAGGKAVVVTKKTQVNKPKDKKEESVVEEKKEDAPAEESK